MTPVRSLQWRLGWALGLSLTMLWIGAAWVTTVLARHAMDEIFDSALQETAQRILPLAVADILAREEEGVTQRQSVVRQHDELLSYAVRDGQGRFLLLSHDTNPDDFPAWEGPGWGQSATHRLYSEQALQGSVRITVAEPLAHRAAVSQRIQVGLVLPLLVFLPLALAAIVLAVRASLAPLHRFRERLASRSERDLSLVPVDDLPAEIMPVARTLNDLLSRLAAAFDAERSFAANAAHELRTPLAGAIAQIQRLKAETQDAAAVARAGPIEATLKRLTRLSERLMQLARAEGGRLRLEHVADLRPVARIVSEELDRTVGAGRIDLSLPDSPLLSDLDPDVFAILFRNLVENALRHGAPDEPVRVSLLAQGVLTVTNDGPAVAPEVLSRLLGRFERAGNNTDGSGLGLAIVHAVVQRIGGSLTLTSPLPGQDSGFEAALTLPVAPGSPGGMSGQGR